MCQKTDSRSPLIHVLATLSLLGLLFLHSSHARASTQCTPDIVNGGQDCISQVNFSQFAQTAFQTQQLTEWCWAASIAMVWAYYGHPVAQSEIVDAVFGGVTNSPAQDAQILQALSGPRTDDNGKRFNSNVTGVYDAQSGIATLSYTQLGSELDANRPIIIGTVNPDGSGGHAVVLTAISYYVPAGYPIQIDPSGINITGAGVFDPWPGNGAHGISLSQLTPASQNGSLFLVATVTVADVAQQQASGGSTTSSDSGGGGKIDGLLNAMLAVAVAFAFVSRRAHSRILNTARPLPGLSTNG